MVYPKVLFPLNFIIKETMSPCTFCRPGPLATRSTIGKDCQSLSSQIEDDLNAADAALSKSG